jgi:hypothetical protein
MTTCIQRQLAAITYIEWKKKAPTTRSGSVNKVGALKYLLLVLLWGDYIDRLPMIAPDIAGVLTAPTQKRTPMQREVAISFFAEWKLWSEKGNDYLRRHANKEDKRSWFLV